MANLNANQKKLYNLSLKYNEDPAKWLAIYEIESTSGTNMKASSGATGHFQIMPQFYKDYGVTRDETLDLEKSFLAVRQHHARNSTQLRAKLGRELTAGEYYLGISRDGLVHLRYYLIQKTMWWMHWLLLCREKKQKIQLSKMVGKRV